MKNFPPLSLYIHLPWCVEKCPYCDFNSHKFKSMQILPQSDYIQHLLNDLENDLQFVSQKKLHSIFIGGGTPSLFNAENISFLLNQIKEKIEFDQNIEITIEANPGTIDEQNFIGYKKAGINRISIGVQTFNDEILKKLGRIHSKNDAISAINLAKSLEFKSINVDIMHGLPNQTIENAMNDLEQIIQFDIPHFSWYELTIEPNTLFASDPPKLPNEDLLWEIYQKGQKKLINAGFKQYEVSGYSKPSFQCKHNLNYWRFGDYLGIGCGASGKLTQKNGEILRTTKTKHPKGFMQGNYLQKQKIVQKSQLSFEYFLNRCRLFEPIPKQEFENLTKIKPSEITLIINQAISKGFLTENTEYWFVTNKGKLFLNSLLHLFI